MRFKIDDALDFDTPSSRSDDDSRPKPSDFRFNMTTCIAAISGRSGLNESPDVVVTASDTRVSFDGEYSADGTVKLHMIHPDWGVLMAGSDLSQYPYIIKRAQKLLSKQLGTLETVTTAMKKAYHDQLQEVITDDLLSRYEMTMTEFKRRGRGFFRPEIYEELSLKIKLYTLGCTFLVYGHDEKGIAHLFSIFNPGKAENHDKPGFWAIGNGARAALIMLSALKQIRGKTLFADTVYNVLAAKYFSEKAEDVGEETFLWVQLRHSRGFETKKDLEKNIRVAWEKDGLPKTNPDAIKEILEGDWKFKYPSRGKRLRIESFLPYR